MIKLKRFYFKYSIMTYYAATIKKTRGVPVESDYEDYLSEVFRKNPSIADRGRFYEYTRGCHVHMLLYSERPIGYSDLKIHNHGWNVNLSVVRSLGAWNTYIRKDQGKLIEEEAERDVCEVTRRDFSVSPPVEGEISPLQLYKKYGRIV